MQSLFRELGYPLGSDRAGVLGVRTRGAVSYFQRKYALPVSGYPNRATVAKMRAVAGVVTAAPRPAARVRAPRDRVSRVLGGVPVTTVAIALAALLALLALTALWRSRAGHPTEAPDPQTGAEHHQ
ncbi:MAG TPA: peptidoglycan-binding domain-containing protein [Solirubrobacteraceae bacterium]|nr:peptidoglycan-binding domain-containing protein [Solirubrobacteraceae bacterium]